MTPTNRLMLLIAAAAFTPSPAAGRTLDRRGAVRVALEQNPQVAAARAEEAVLRAQRRQADAARWPMVTLETGVGPSLEATLVPGTAVQSTQEQYRNLALSDLSAVFLANLTVIQPLYTFGKIARRQDAAGHGLKAREAQTRIQRLDVAFEVARIYEGYLLARDSERFLRETIHWLESTLEATQERLAQNTGSHTEMDVLRLQSGLAIARMGHHQAQAGKVQAGSGLAAYLGLAAGDEFAVSEDELTAVGQVPKDFASLIVLANERRPEIVALAEGQRAIDALARAEAAGLAPDLFVMALLSTAYTPGRTWIQSRFVIDPLNHFIPGALLGLRWQFQGDMASARAEQEKARAAVLRNMSRWADAGIPAEIRRAYEDVRRYAKDIDQGSVAIGKAKQWMVQASADYSVGMLDIREVSDAVAAYTMLRTAVMKARYEHNVAMAALSRATGTLDGDDGLFYLAPPAVTPAREVRP